MFEKRWEELHDEKVVGMSLGKRLESGQKGKVSANAYVPFSFFFSFFSSSLVFTFLCLKSLLVGINWLTSSKYKDHNWFGAMYTYALAWGCLIPYHPDSMSDQDPKKAEIVALYVVSSMLLSSPSLSSTFSLRTDAR
jgi:hypothetical protein